MVTKRNSFFGFNKRCMNQNLLTSDCYSLFPFLFLKSDGGLLGTKAQKVLKETYVVNIHNTILYNDITQYYIMTSPERSESHLILST